MRRGFPNVEALRLQLDKGQASQSADGSESAPVETNAQPARKRRHPRWVRINTVKTTLKEQLATTFAGYTVVDSVEEILETPKSELVHLDKHIPNLIAVPQSAEVVNTAAYLEGQLILQEKASCFPAYLLGAPCEGKDYLDACAAPGNKTTHMAAILRDASSSSKSRTKIFACERDKTRAMILQRMVSLAGVEDVVTVRPGQDFLRLDPDQPPWDNVGSILLDPSCSGSGIVGRDETPNITLPNREDIQPSGSRSRKRKRRSKDVPIEAGLTEKVNTPVATDQNAQQHDERLAALSAFQLRILLHAFQFSNASRIVYSTCSVHAQENEYVIMKALQSSQAIEGGWRIVLAEEQPSGLQSWHIRGQRSACLDALSELANKEVVTLVEKVASACIRCERATKEGTQGFFVAGFSRSERDLATLSNDPKPTDSKEVSQLQSSDLESDWEGFSSCDSP